VRDKSVDLFKALGDITRQEILALLRKHEMNVTDICKTFEEMTQPTISHHLHILKNCDLVDTRREGKMIYYYVNKKMLHDGIIEFLEKFEIEF